MHLNKKVLRKKKQNLGERIIAKAKSDKKSNKKEKKKQLER